MSERRNNERRKWGRKVTYPFIGSDGVLVTKNRRKIVDRRAVSNDAVEQKATQTKQPVIPTLNDVKPSPKIKDSRIMEFEEVPLPDDGPASIIDASIKNLESQILSETNLALKARANTSASSKEKTLKSSAKITEENSSVSMKLSINGTKHVLSEIQNTCQVGRDKSCDIVIQGKFVSRIHAKIIYKNGKFLLQDNSFNGTYIKFDNGQKVHVTKNEQNLISNGVMSMGEPVKNNPNSLIQFKIQQ